MSKPVCRCSNVKIKDVNCLIAQYPYLNEATIEEMLKIGYGCGACRIGGETQFATVKEIMNING